LTSKTNISNDKNDESGNQVTCYYQKRQLMKLGMIGGKNRQGIVAIEIALSVLRI